MENNKYLANERREYFYEDEDEIDLHDILRILTKNKTMIAAITLMTFAASAGAAYIMRKSQLKAQGIIAFDYNGIESGKNPDGTAFDKDKIISTKALNKIYNKFELSNEFKGKIDDFSKSIKIEGITPANISSVAEEKLKKGELFEYNPTQYKIELGLKDSQQSKEVLEELLKSSLTEYKNELIPKDEIALIPGGILANEDYDYEEYVDIFKAKIGQIKSNIIMSEKNSSFTNSLGYSYNDIAAELKNIEAIDLNALSSYIEVYRVSKNTQMLKNKYINKIKMLVMEKDKITESAQMLRKVIAEYKPTEKQIIFSSGGEAGIKLNNVDEYYSNLINEYKTSSLKIIEIDSKIKYFENEIKAIKIPTEKQAKYLEGANRKIILNINNVLVKLNALNEVYNLRRYGNFVKEIVPVTVVSPNSKTPLILAAGMVLGVFLGVFLAFVREFLEDYKKKNSKEAVTLAKA